MSVFTMEMIAVNTLFWLVCCFGTAFFVRLFPEYVFKKMEWFFRERSFEKKLYQKMHVPEWKDHLPEWGKVWNFEKKRLSKERHLPYVDRFILETYYAEAGHMAMALLGFACIAVNPREYALMAFVCAAVNFVIQIPFCLIQRYNRPRLLKLRARYTWRRA